MLGRETRAKGAEVLLAPTVNLHRTPIGGRNFECMSEDPYLTARIAVAYVRGCSPRGVASCIKHFVGNDTEFERMTIDSQIDERTLRELYLVPFEAAVTRGRRARRDDGVQPDQRAVRRDSEPLVRGVLRDEWGFDGAGDERLVRAALDGRSARRRARPRDAGPDAVPRRRRCSTRSSAATSLPSRCAARR